MNDEETWRMLHDMNRNLSIIVEMLRTILELLRSKL